MAISIAVGQLAEPRVELILFGEPYAPTLVVSRQVEAEIAF
jgi:hypothetical protein